MNKIHLITVFIFSLSFTLNADILIKNGNIYSGDSAPFIGDIYIKDGKIHSIGSLNIKASKEIDAQGKIVTPGFIAPMTLIGIVEINSLDVTRDDESDYLNMGFSIFRAYNPNSTLIPWNRANGITSAISIPQQTSMPLAGMGSYFILDGNMNISGSKDIMMLGRIGASSGSRSEDLDLLENLISLGKLAKNRPYEKVIESPIAVFFELLIQDIEALDKVANEGLPLVIKANRALIRSLECLESVTWANFVQPLERAEQNLSSVWSLLSHYNGVLNSPELRDVYSVCLERVTEYGTCLLYTSDAADE